MKAATLQSEERWSGSGETLPWLLGGAVHSSHVKRGRLDGWVQDGFLVCRLWGLWLCQLTCMQLLHCATC